MRPPRRPSTLMLRATPTIFALALFAALSLAPAASFAQVCEGVAYYEACLDAVAGRPMGSTAARDPTRIINGIFRTNDTPPRFAPELTFARLIPSRSVFTYPSCMGGRNTNPRMYTANECVGPLPPEAGGALPRLARLALQRHDPELFERNAGRRRRLVRRRPRALRV